MTRTDPRIPAARLDGALLPFRSRSFDAVVLQDVVEHLPAPALLLRELRRVLKPGGILYLSTPNRFSVFNIAADPHWGLPFVALLRRRGVRFVVHTLLRRDPERADFAELFSLPALRRVLSVAGFDPRLRQRAAVREMFDRPERMVWSAFHRSLLSAARLLRLRGAAAFCANDAPGMFNRWIAPAWYLIGRTA